MKITTILFDLDGTLLPMDQDKFMQEYFTLMAKRMINYGYEPQKLIQSIWDGTKQMILNDGSKTNEQVFWNRFEEIYGEQVREHHSVFEQYYIEDFPLVKETCGFNPQSKTVIKDLQKQGFRLVLATNPLFPKIATKQRIEWCDLEESDFEFYTTYENERFCKPNPKYYLDILERLNVKPEEVLMVGNDVIEDIKAAESVGMNVFLITDTMINKNNDDISNYPKCNFENLINWIKKSI